MLTPNREAVFFARSNPSSSLPSVSTNSNTALRGNNAEAASSSHHRSSSMSTASDGNRSASSRSLHAAPLRLVGRHGAWGLRVAWFVYRGPADQVTFDPYQFKTYPDYRSNSPWTPGWEPPALPPDGRFPVSATFAEPGLFVVRVMAHDGGLKDTEDVTVTVTE